MKKQWLSGILLGVSTALLLAGGVVVAASLSLTVDKGCFECWEGVIPGEAGAANVVPDEKLVTFTVGGYEDAPVCWWWRIDGELVEEFCMMPPDEPPTKGILWATCEPEFVYFGWGIPVPMNGDDQALPIGADLPFTYGEWTVKACQDEARVSANGWENCDEVGFYFLEDCSILEEEEFVPELGSIFLLGSGLAGLAGYATLRWRARE